MVALFASMIGSNIEDSVHQIAAALSEQRRLLREHVRRLPDEPPPVHSSLTMITISAGAGEPRPAARRG
jgi:hypothetical protein